MLDQSTHSRSHVQKSKRWKQYRLFAIDRIRFFSVLQQIERESTLSRILRRSTLFVCALTFTCNGFQRTAFSYE